MQIGFGLCIMSFGALGTAFSMSGHMSFSGGIFMDKKTVKTACHICHGSCIAEVTVEDGRVTEIRPDPDGIMNKGRMCPKGLASLELIYNPDRLLHPLRGRFPHRQPRRLGSRHFMPAGRCSAGRRMQNRRNNIHGALPEAGQGLGREKSG